MKLQTNPRNKQEQEALHKEYKRLFEEEEGRKKNKSYPPPSPFTSSPTSREQIESPPSIMRLLGVRIGIYTITCSISGNCYVGSSKSISERWNSHISDLNKGEHSSIALQRAWDKYGRHSFSFDIVEECPPHMLSEREQHWMDKLVGSLYNSNPYADRPPPSNLHSKESNLKKGLYWKGKKRPPRTEKHKKNLSKALKGIKKNMTSEQIQERNRKARESRVKNGNILHTEATKEKISENRKGKGGGPMSLSRRMNISKALKGNPNNVGSTGKHTWTPRWKGQNRSPEVIEKITLSKRHKAMNDKQVSQFKALYPTNYGELLNVVNY